MLVSDIYLDYNGSFHFKTNRLLRMFDSEGREIIGEYDKYYSSIRPLPTSKSKASLSFFWHISYKCAINRSIEND